RAGAAQESGGDRGCDRTFIAKPAAAGRVRCSRSGFGRSLQLGQRGTPSAFVLRAVALRTPAGGRGEGGARAPCADCRRGAVSAMSGTPPAERGSGENKQCQK